MDYANQRINLRRVWVDNKVVERMKTEQSKAPATMKLIEYTRGAVKIVNRKELENSACECYGVIQQYDGELGLK
jgi:hypothetical protein